MILNDGSFITVSFEEEQQRCHMNIKKQLTIVRWNTKNYRWVYLFFCLLYIVIFPGSGLVLWLKRIAE